MRQLNHGQKAMNNALFDFLADHDLDDLPDGAWQQMIEDAVEEWNRLFKTKYDPYDTWLAYIERKAELQNETAG